MAEYVDSLATDSPYYLKQWPLFRHIPALRDDVGSLRPYMALPGKPTPSTEELLFFAAAGAFSVIHFDDYDNLNAQIWGKKKFYLFAPEQGKNLSPYWKGGMYNFSPVGIENADLTDYPLAARVRGLQCTVGPGDLIYIPPRWWHCVQSLTTSISMANWWSHSRGYIWRGKVRDKLTHFFATKVLRQKSLRRRDQQVHEWPANKPGA
jgi:lysine-specific demethylase 8